MPLYEITPKDLLFIGDGRPMAAAVGPGGHGAHWPAPSVIFDAIHAALWRAFPNEEGWELRHHFGRSRYRYYKDAEKKYKRFGSLRTAGPFPVLNGQWLFPRPEDVILETMDDGPADPWSGTIRVRSPLPVGTSGSTDLPFPWLRPPASLTRTGKTSPAPWWTREIFQTYLSGELAGTCPNQLHMFAGESLFEGEWTTGIGMDEERGVQDGKRIYSAEYLRLTQKAALGIHATLPMGQSDDGEALGNLWEDDGFVMVGGQQRPCHVSKVRQRNLAELLPKGAPINSHKVKWVLLSPAVYPAIEEGVDTTGNSIRRHDGGWLPNWICPETGRVLLKRETLARKPGQTRHQWRKQVRALSAFGEEAKLVSAHIPKPQIITGWSDSFHLDHTDHGENGKGSGHGPKVTHLAVPAGSVYYFECTSRAAAAALADALNWHGPPSGEFIVNRRSTLLGEKGLGLGVCGDWI